ncbi:MAG: asparagine synthase (glutamine-hydrolyzing), partial [Piscirickettsiaceae bacterium]
MCGITGFMSIQGHDLNGETILASMASKIVHRGPDADGQVLLHNATVGLAHRRLSILDLSEAGAQPMRSSDGRYTIVYNGETYNFLTIRMELEQRGQVFIGHSDTEVVLAAIEMWGIGDTLEKMTGMFVFAVWDAKEKKLTLVRDRIGEKPLYYSLTKEKYVIFGSEMNSMRAFPGWKPQVDRNSLALYLRHMYIPAPFSIYEQTWKLEPGHYLEIDCSSDQPEIGPSRAYWSASEVWQQEKVTLNDDQAIDQLESILNTVVSDQMISDVPLGAFLSGGIDSSLVTSIMQANSSKPIKTFTIGFEEAGYNEAEHAKAVATHLGTDHTELYVSSEEARKVIPEMAKIYDEPFADSSQIPTYLVSKLAKSSVSVVLSGDGGDEIFGGYLYFHKAPNAEELHKETVRKLDKLYQYDCLRANKSLAAWGIEGRVPFLDKEFMDVAMSINPQDKMINGERMEKWVLRKAFESYLPESITWRQKEQFSDGVGYNWIDTLKALVDTSVSDEKMQHAKHRFPVQTPRTKEEYYYRSVFEQHFPSETAALT